MENSPDPNTATTAPKVSIKRSYSHPPLFAQYLLCHLKICMLVVPSINKTMPRPAQGASIPVSMPIAASSSADATTYERGSGMPSLLENALMSLNLNFASAKNVTKSTMRTKRSTIPEIIVGKAIASIYASIYHPTIAGRMTKY